jgi:hypothetical protein
MRGKSWPPSVGLLWIYPVAGNFLEEKLSLEKAQKAVCIEKSRKNCLLRFGFVVG